MLRMDVFISLSTPACPQRSTGQQSGTVVLLNHWHDSLISRATILIAHIHHVGDKAYRGNIAHTHTHGIYTNIITRLHEQPWIPAHLKWI